MTRTVQSDSASWWQENPLGQHLLRRIAQDVLPWDAARNTPMQQQAYRDAVINFIGKKYSDPEGKASQRRIPFDSQEFVAIYEQFHRWFEAWRANKPGVVSLMDWPEVSFHRERARTLIMALGIYQKSDPTCRRSYNDKKRKPRPGGRQQ